MKTPKTGYGTRPLSPGSGGACRPLRGVVVGVGGERSGETLDVHRSPVHDEVQDDLPKEFFEDGEEVEVNDPHEVKVLEDPHET